MHVPCHHSSLLVSRPSWKQGYLNTINPRNSRILYWLLSLLLWQHTWQRQLKEGRVYFVPWFWGTVHPDRDAMTVGGEDSRSHDVCSQEAKNIGCWCLTCFLLLFIEGLSHEKLPAFRVGLPTSVKALWKHVQRHTVSWEILYPMELTKIIHHKCL